MSKPFDMNLYEATLEACHSRDVPEDLTLKAAMIIASDNPGEPNFGRTTEDQEIIKEVLPYLQSGGKE